MIRPLSEGLDGSPTHFLKMRFKQSFRPIYCILKKRKYFGKKAIKNHRSVGVQIRKFQWPPAARGFAPRSRIVISTLSQRTFLALHVYNNCRKRIKANVLLLHLRFLPIFFTSNSVVFVGVGEGQKYFFVSGR